MKNLLLSLALQTACVAANNTTVISDDTENYALNHDYEGLEYAIAPTVMLVCWVSFACLRAAFKAGKTACQNDPEQQPLRSQPEKPKQVFYDTLQSTLCFWRKCTDSYKEASSSNPSIQASP